MKSRGKLDIIKFKEQAKTQNQIIQILDGIHEIKLNGLNELKRSEWEQLQLKLFQVNISGLKINQYQDLGSLLINETKNLVITFFAATFVISGSLTIGMMVAIMFVIGQLNNPIVQVVSIIRAFQDAQLSYSRLKEVREIDPEPERGTKVKRETFQNAVYIKNLYFKYSGQNESCLRNISITIPASSTTAIVGPSGSGKSTLIKMILKLLTPSKGEIKLGYQRLNEIENGSWREKCGAVTPDSYVFSGSILDNINIGKNEVDHSKLYGALQIANVSSFIDELPSGLLTRITPEGHGLSQGQIQRILLARALYKGPELLLLDEATNCLDIINEKSILEGIRNTFPSMTIVICTHRSSTIKYADHIIVLDKGEISEYGNHNFLINNRGKYYELFKQQSEFN
jgi:ATP-binding cassette subfamily B protein